MTKAEEYFNEQHKNREFTQAYNEISEKIDLEWELERVKNHIKNDASKNIILQELDKLQDFVRNAVFMGNSPMIKPTFP